MGLPSNACPPSLLHRKWRIIITIIYIVQNTSAIYMLLKWWDLHADTCVLKSFRCHDLVPNNRFGMFSQTFFQLLLQALYCF